MPNQRACKSVISTRFTHNGTDDEQEAKEANSGCYHYAAGTKNIGIERSIGRYAAAHQNEAHDDNQHAKGNEQKIDFIKSKIRFHIVYVIES